MKIVPLTSIILVLGLGIFGYTLCSDQATTMNLAVGASGGSSDTEPSGLRQTNKDLEIEVATISKERSDALKQQKDAFIMMQRAVEERDTAERKLADNKESLAEWEEKVKEAQARVEEVQKEREHILATLRTMPALGSDIDLATAVEKLASVVENEKKMEKQLTQDLEEKTEVRKIATEKVAKEQAELDRLVAINDQFFKDYTKNSDEYSILAVDPRWKFVVFNAGKDSGIVAGGSTPMLVKRGNDPIITLRVVSVNGGQVIAEYDAEQLPHGVQLEVGDKVFRQKPLGS
ncbi:MAG: hypothetical protein IKV82_09180 [Akkermansia sp.]|nr:hypothetical protein [Akkermansia sp.]